MDSKVRLLLIGFLIFTYVILMVYIFFKYSPENGELVTEWPPADSLYEDTGTDNAPELLANFMNAYQRGDFDDARAYADSLNSKFPGSLYAQRANEILTGLNTDLTDKKVAAQKTPSSSIQRTSSRSTSPSRSRTTRSTPPRKTQAQIIEESEARLEKAMEKLRMVEDTQQQNTWYYNKNISHYVYKNSLEAYIGKNDAGDIWLRMRIYYTGEKPLNIESYEVNVADKDYPISTLYGNMERGRGSAGGWEWYDAQVSAKDLSMLRNVAEVGQTEIRYIGKSGTLRRMMTEPEKLRLSYILEGYDAMVAQKQLLQ